MRNYQKSCWQNKTASIVYFVWQNVKYRYGKKCCIFASLHSPPPLPPRIGLKHLLFSEICAREIYEKFVSKHSETIEYVKNQPTF